MAQSEAYCEYANGRLPTEAQWEKAARGPNGNIYPWGNGTPTADLLNYNNIIGATTNVIDFPQGKSFYDALDMEGNVYEWVYDWYDPLYYKSGPTQDPQGPDSGSGGQRSVRSAGFKSNADQVVSSVRSFKLATTDERDLGFRCVVKDPTFFAPACQLALYEGGNLGGFPGSTSSGSACQPPKFSVNGPDCQQPSGVVTVDAGSGDTNVQTNGSGGCMSIPNGGHTAKYDCTNAGSVNVSYVCGSSGQVSQGCPAHYNLQNGICVWDKSGTAGQACPAGQQMNPAMNCCTSTPGTGKNFSVCPPGSSLQNLGKGQFACVQNGAAGSQQSVSVSVSAPPSPAQCSTGGNCPAQACHISGETWNSQLCKCVCPRPGSCG
jgi:Sulfatase-modifying factor enzyme 1